MTELAVSRCFWKNAVVAVRHRIAVCGCDRRLVAVGARELQRENAVAVARDGRAKLAREIVPGIVDARLLARPRVAVALVRLRVGTRQRRRERPEEGEYGAEK
jgi:hypothetical protein